MLRWMKCIFGFHEFADYVKVPETVDRLRSGQIYRLCVRCQHCGFQKSHDICVARGAQ